LASFVEAQKYGALDGMLLSLCNHTKCVNLKPVCYFVIGNMQGGDNKIMCTSASFSSTMNCLCLKCNIRGHDEGDPFIGYQHMSMIKIMELVHQKGPISTMCTVHGLMLTTVAVAMTFLLLARMLEFPM
jgi:hypothetical protein